MTTPLPKRDPVEPDAPPPSALMLVGAWTTVGVRQRNEDAFAVHPELGLLVIADGMGGHSNGHEASAEAVEAAVAHLLAAEDPAAALADAILAAQARVAGHRDNRGTTLTLAMIVDGALHVAHVGDTRVYLGERQITRDQGIGYVLEEFVGGDYPPLIQEHLVELPEDCWILLSSDGIHDSLPIDHILLPTARACGGDPTLTAKMLALAAVHAGSSDNCTAIVAHIRR